MGFKHQKSRYNFFAAGSPKVRMLFRKEMKITDSCGEELTLAQAMELLKLGFADTNDSWLLSKLKGSQHKLRAAAAKKFMKEEDHGESEKAQAKS